MRKIMFVDDEVLALNYLRNLINWEEEGYQIVGCVSNGKKALDIYERAKPDIVISDIKMSGMDGLELARQLKLRNSDIVIILLSAYKEFTYAQKGIEYHVNNYLLKHELCKEVLLKELEKIQSILKEKNEKKKIYQRYFMNNLIYNMTDDEKFQISNLGNRFCIMMIHKNHKFLKGIFYEVSWETAELNGLKRMMETEVEGLIYITDIRITSNNLLVLYKIENIKSKYLISGLIYEKGLKLREYLKKEHKCNFNIIYSSEIERNEISEVFQKMSYQVRSSPFWEPQSCRKLSLYHLQEKNEGQIAWNGQMKELHSIVYRENQLLDGFLEYLFDLTKSPTIQFHVLRELLHAMENLVREIEEKEGLARKEEEKEIYKIDQIQEYYKETIKNLSYHISDRKENKYSNITIEILRYIRKNYYKDLSLDSLGNMFSMNGVYLGQVFKKEVGMTFLKFLTDCRIEESKKLLLNGQLNISQVSEQVGYKTSQYFSQIFQKHVGMKPQEFKKWS